MNWTKLGDYLQVSNPFDGDYVLKKNNEEIVLTREEVDLFTSYLVTREEQRRATEQCEEQQKILYAQSNEQKKPSPPRLHPYLL